MGMLASADVNISKVQIHVMRCNNGPTMSFVEMISIRYLDLVSSCWGKIRSKHNFFSQVVPIFFFLFQKDLDLLTSGLFDKKRRKDRKHATF